jgi:alkyl sulfatase BDS1-like metallo-beta-lactamase superfamily hydrolase
VPQIFDSVGIRVDGPRAWNEHLAISWVITDTGTTHVTELRHGVLSHRSVGAPAPDTTVVTLSRQALLGLVTGALDLAQAIADGSVKVQGDAAVLSRQVGVLAPVYPNFAIVTP